jgi:Zn-dependent peptidase ImmA (M78 family)
MGSDYDPYEHAETLGIHVIHRPIRSAHELWLPDWNLIVVRTGMRQIHDRCALAHGLAHAVLGHRDDRPKHELAADRIATMNLIDPDELYRAAMWTPDCFRLAAELGVTTRITRTALGLYGIQENAPAA